MVNNKLLILVVLISILLVIGIKPKLQSVAPSCFEKLDCIVPVQLGFCEVQFDCVVGTCYEEQINCPEVCFGWQDEDADGLIDCKDPDCFNSKHCPCEQASFNRCNTNQCYCSSGAPKWIIFEGQHWCQCN